MDAVFEDAMVYVVLENRVHVQINLSPKTPPGRERLRIIFWNVKQRDLSPIVCSLAMETQADVIILSENKACQTTLQSLHEIVSPSFYIPNPTASPNRRFHCFCRDPRLDMSEVHSGFRLSVRKLNVGIHNTLLAIVHGPDIRNNDHSQRQAFAAELATEIQFTQKEHKNNKLILLGDFNMNPYDPGMNLANGLNAMMTKTCVQSGTRRHNQKTYDFYYNPMWSLFGDIPDGPAGTIYNTSNQGPYGWSMVDQAIIHHSIVNLFADVKILTTCTSRSLMNSRGRPDSKNVSDHFPIMLTLHKEI